MCHAYHVSKTQKSTSSTATVPGMSLQGYAAHM